MIPSLKQIQNRSNPIEQKPYFSMANEYLTLKKKISLFLIVDMILYPLYIYYQLFQGDYSPMYVFGIVKAYTCWKDLFRYFQLQTEIETWFFIVKLFGGPWISTNDSEYHIYVYADAMERIVLSHIK